MRAWPDLHGFAGSRPAAGAVEVNGCVTHRISVTGLPDDAGDLEISFSGGDWHPCPWEGSGPARTARLLVAGPAATKNPDKTVVLTLGRNKPRGRLTDNPEVVIRYSGGAIDVG